MVTQKILWINPNKFSNLPDAFILMRLMLACNDLNLANYHYGLCEDCNNSFRKHLKEGAKMYFGRIQASHLYEALKIIEEIKPKSASVITPAEESDNIEESKPSSKLPDFLKNKCCPDDIRELFDKLINLAADQGFKKILGVFRHKLTSHYGDNEKRSFMKTIQNLERMSKEYKITPADDPSYSRFNIADDFCDIYFSDLQKIENDENYDEILKKISYVAYDFVEFCQLVVPKYLRFKGIYK